MVGDNPRCEDNTLRFHVFSVAAVSHEPPQLIASDPQLARGSSLAVYSCLTRKRVKIPLSSSIVLRRFPPISDDRETTRSMWGEMRCLHGKMRCLRVQESAFSHRYSIVRKGGMLT